MILASDPSPWLEVFGRFHPVLLHLPIGLLPALVVLEFGGALVRRPVGHGVLLTLSLLLAGSAALAAASGLVLAGEQSDGDLLRQHKLLGIGLAVSSLALPITAALRPRLPFRIAVVLTAGLSVPAGHLGAGLTHGRDFLFEPLADRAPAGVPTVPENPVGPSPLDPGTQESSRYLREIVPILERTCVKCHNPDKQKGELLLTTPEGIRQGGENGTVLEPGKPEDSELLSRCLLPLDHDDHMPPEGKPQPTADELATLRAWILAGAPFE